VQLTAPINSRGFNLQQYLVTVSTQSLALVTNVSIPSTLRVTSIHFDSTKNRLLVVYFEKSLDNVLIGTIDTMYVKYILCLSSGFQSGS
jgi:hypothetical protein